jgi:hypothetical protein
MKWLYNGNRKMNSILTRFGQQLKGLPFENEFAKSSITPNINQPGFAH